MIGVRIRENEIDNQRAILVTQDAPEAGLILLVVSSMLKNKHDKKNFFFIDHQEETTRMVTTKSDCNSAPQVFAQSKENWRS